MRKTAWNARCERRYVRVRNCLLDQGQGEPPVGDIAPGLVERARTTRRAAVTGGNSTSIDLATSQSSGGRLLIDAPRSDLEQSRDEACQRHVWGRASMRMAAVESALQP